MQVGRRCAITVTVAVASASLLGVSAASADTPPAPVLTLRSPAAHPFAGRTFHLTGALTPAAAGDEVRLQRRTGGEFQTIATQPLSATGGFDFGLREKTVGAYAYRVERPADPADPATDPTDPADPPAPAGPVDSPTRTVVVTGTTLGPGGVLSAGADLWSPNRGYHLVMRADGDLVLRHRSRTVWTTRTGGHAGARTTMRTDGNLVVSLGSRRLWATGTSRHPGAVLRVRDDGNLVVTRQGTTLWARVRPTPSPTFGERTMTRAESWSRARVGYSLVQSFTNRYGTYRRDCSGFVSMAWALGSSYSTWTLPRVAHPLTKAGLRRGDILLHRPASGYGHVVIFDRWANRAHSAYVAYEQTPGTGDKHHTLPYPYYRNHGTYTPYRRNGV